MTEAETQTGPEGAFEALPTDQEAELPGPVQLYLQEIGAVRLLTAAQEVELAKEIENGRLLARLQRELTSEHESLSYETLAGCLLKRLCKLIDRVRSVVTVRAAATPRSSSTKGCSGRFKARSTESWPTRSGMSSAPLAARSRTTSGSYRWAAGWSRRRSWMPDRQTRKSSRGWRTSCARPSIAPARPRTT